jgi:peptidoglycan hydrolase CwlO-like protein
VKKLGEKKGFGEERELDLGEVYQRVRGLVKKKRNYKSQVNKMDALVSDLNQQIVRLEGEVDRLSKEGEIKNREF